VLVAKPRSGFAGLRLWRQLARGAQGIAAESPQELHRQFRGLGAESPFCGVLRRKGAQIPDRSKITNEFLEKFFMLNPPWDWIYQLPGRLAFLLRRGVPSNSK
jgi:hypothetical protein